MVMRKWEFIANRLIEAKSPKEIVKAAQRIDFKCYQRYGDKYTRVWGKWDLKDIKQCDAGSEGFFEELLNIVASPTSCNFCVEFEYDCDMCPIYGGDEEVPCNTDFQVVAKYCHEQVIALAEEKFREIAQSVASRGF